MNWMAYTILSHGTQEFRLLQSKFLNGSRTLNFTGAAATILSYAAIPRTKAGGKIVSRLSRHTVGHCRTDPY